MAARSFDARAYVEAAAQLVGMSFDPVYPPGVILNVERIAQMAGLVTNFPLPSDAEPPPILTR
jgi:hypothetical protein